MAEAAKEVSKRNWADEEDDGQDEEDVEIGGATVAQVGQKMPTQEATAPVEEEKKEQQQRTFMPPKPRTKRERNIHGDFVVTKINIKDTKVEVPVQDNDEEEEEESEESEEEVVEQPVQEEEKKKGKFL